MPTFDEVIERELTPQQIAVVKDPAREILCLACAGSGKTKTLAFRTARLLTDGVDPRSIVAFTFTEKAAESIKLRISQALAEIGHDPSVLGALYVGTIHSYCQYVLGEIDARYRQFDVMDDNRLHLYLLSRFYPGDRRLNLPAVQDSRPGGRARNGMFKTIKEVARAWKTVNDEMLDITNVSEMDEHLGGALIRLSEGLQRDEYIDFSMMIRRVVEALQNGDPNASRAVAALKHLMVDEYQDVNPAQETLIRSLHPHLSSLFVVGDDDQAIYGWRGADVDNILTFQDRYAECSVHTLAHNFRSTRAIVRSADDFAAEELGARRFAKAPEADNPKGARDYRVLWFPDRNSEAEWVAERIDALLGTTYHERDGVVRGLTPADFAILMRSTGKPEQDGNPRHHQFTHALQQRNIEFSLEAGGGIFDRPQIDALRETLELLRGGPTTRERARSHFDGAIISSFPNASFTRLANVLTDWGRRIHSPIGGARQRVYPQQLVHELLAAFGLPQTTFSDVVMQELGLFSNIIQDVETVYMSIDSPGRFREVLNFLQNIARDGYEVGTEDVVRRPNAVTVSTVHKVKGLEFPVVFVVDTEENRFPGTQRGYDGWIPQRALQAALNRGAYHGTPAEEARLFYTAITRAERFLYVTASAHLPGGRSTRRPSRFSQRLRHDEIAKSGELPSGLTHQRQIRRIDEIVVPTSYSDIRYYLRCPRDYRFRKGYGFSPPITDMFGFGQTVHAAICKLHELYPDNAPSGEEAQEIAQDVFHLKHVPASADPLGRPGPYERAMQSSERIASEYAERYASDFSQQRQVEVRFEIPADRVIISGSIDLLLKEDEQGNILEATVVDFKAMEGGNAPAETESLNWTELSLQVQLYARAAREVLGENAQTGAVHLLKDNQRQLVPVTNEAINAAVANVEWAVERILAEDFPMRPHPQKCADCDFAAICPRLPEQFGSHATPPPIHVPGRDAARLARAFSEFTDG